MTKREFIRAFMAEHNVDRDYALKTTELVFDFMRKKLLEGHEVRMDGIGRLFLRYTKPRSTTNNLTGDKIKVGPRVKLKFSPFPKIRRALSRALKSDLQAIAEESK